ncbi:MAG: AraC family transcriptional regulator [Candidatus Polarisedimenticolia bacterium]
MDEAASGKTWRHPEPTTLVGVPLGLIRMMEEHGLDRARILKSARLSEPLLADPDGRLASIHSWRLWRLAMECIPDEELGIYLASTLQVRRTGLMGYSILYSRTVGQALTRLTRYSHIVSETLGYKLERGTSHTRLTLDPDARFDALRHPIDLRLGGVLTIVREVSGRPIEPLRVHLPYPRPAKTTELMKLFQAPLTFEAPRAMLDLKNSDLELPLISADERLVKYLDQLADETVRALSRSGSLSDRIMRALWSALPDGVPSLEETATSIGMSARSLQRRLRQEDTSYAAIVDKLRRDMAASLLRDRDLAVYEVGYLLGYSDAASFHRAFRRWNDRSPLEFRRQPGR